MTVRFGHRPGADSRPDASAAALHVNVYRSYGTAQIRRGDLELEFVGARLDLRPFVAQPGGRRRHARRRHSPPRLHHQRHGRQRRTPRVSAKSSTFTTACPTSTNASSAHRSTPDITFSDDPLRMMRAVRASPQLDFTLARKPSRLCARNAQRIEILAANASRTSFFKIVAAPSVDRLAPAPRQRPAANHTARTRTAQRCRRCKRGTATRTTSCTLWVCSTPWPPKSDNIMLRWAALFHDIAKPQTKHFDPARDGPSTTTIS